MTATRLFRIFLFAFLLLRVAPASSQRPVEQSIQRLAQVGTFAFGGVGIAGVTSQGEKDFRVIMAQPPDRALALFEELYKSGNLQAKCYALAGIRTLKAERFKELYAAAVQPWSGHVTTMQGCIMSSEHFRDIVRQIDKGNYDSWIKRNLPHATRS